MARPYRTGSKPIADTCWQAFTTDEYGHLVDVGRPFKIRGRDVGREMDAAQSVKGHEPVHLAEKKARKLYHTNNVSQVRCKRRKRK